MSRWLFFAALSFHVLYLLRDQHIGLMSCFCGTDNLEAADEKDESLFETIQIRNRKKNKEKNDGI